MKLNYLQRVASLAITGALRSTPQVALDTLLQLPCSEVFIESEAMKITFRLKSQIKINSFHRNSHNECHSKLIRMDNILEAHLDKLTKTIL